MKRSIYNKKVLFPVSLFAIVFVISFVVKTNYSTSFAFKNTLPTYGVEDLDDQNMPDKQEKDPVYMSIFKLIVNCNPFKQKTAQ